MSQSGSVLDYFCGLALKWDSLTLLNLFSIAAISAAAFVLVQVLFPCAPDLCMYLNVQGGKSRGQWKRFHETRKVLTVLRRLHCGASTSVSGNIAGMARGVLDSICVLCQGGTSVISCCIT
jgi:hypothetical protein